MGLHVAPLPDKPALACIEQKPKEAARASGFVRGSWIVVGALLLAGCTTPGPTEPSCDNPSWTEGKNTAVIQNSWARTGVRSSPEKEETLGAGSLGFLGHPLDRVEMDFHRQAQDNSTFRGIIAQQGTLSLTLWDEDGAPLTARRNGTGATQHEWVWTDTMETDFTLLVILEDEDQAPRARPVVARWHFDGRPTDPREAQDIAVAWYDAGYWYRTCTPSG